MPMTFAAPNDTAIPIRIVENADLEAELDHLTSAQRAWADAHGFAGRGGQVSVLPGEDGVPATVLVGWGSAQDRARGRFQLAKLATHLPAGTYRLDSDLPTDSATEMALGWLLESYRFDRYTSVPAPKAQLVAPGGVDAARLERIAAGARMAQDLINTPASDMGPAELAAAMMQLGTDHNAEVAVIEGDALLDQNFPMIHAVGRAADQPPRLVDLTWGAPDAPKVTLVGKGVCFDTGGLNIKPGVSMGLMKKDMGGAAHVIGLAHMIMAEGLPVRLRVLVPAVENAISGDAFRPQDVLTSRKGLTVEVNNTDAEGRLVLADALALADAETPQMLVCMATLTGAARVALGPDLPPFFTDHDGLATDLATAGAAVRDPLWRLPFWAPYEEMIEPDVADLDNAPKGGFAGAITAALFLKRFVENTDQFVHMDIYGWTPSAKPARPKGGAFQGARAVFELLCQRYGADT